MPEYFTREEAEALLPRVDPLLRELRTLAASLTDTLEEYTELQEKMRGNGHSHMARYQALRERIGELRGEIEARLQQITELGVLVKDIASGLIDFPSLREGH